MNFCGLLVSLAFALEEVHGVVNKNTTQDCRLEYVVVESVHYSEIVTKECRTFNETSCTNETYEECHDEPKEECTTIEKEICRDRIEEECVTQYKTERSNQKVRECDKECGYKWEGRGTDKRWVIDTSTCKCQDVTRNTVARIPQLNCTLVTREECRSVPVEDCRQVVERRCEEEIGLDG